MPATPRWPIVTVALGVMVAACGGGSASTRIPSATDTSTTVAGPTGGSSSADSNSLAGFLAYAQCMRTHGAPTFPDPIPTPSGGYGFHTQGVNPQSAGFRAASAACNALAPDGWGTAGHQLTPAEQQQWLDWAKCVRTHGAPDFADPTFSGGDVHIAGEGTGIPPQVQTAMDACKAAMPATGGIGG